VSLCGVADWQSAGSRTRGHLADCQSAKRQVANLRYGGNWLPQLAKDAARNGSALPRGSFFFGRYFWAAYDGDIFSKRSGQVKRRHAGAVP